MNDQVFEGSAEMILYVDCPSLKVKEISEGVPLVGAVVRKVIGFSRSCFSIFYLSSSCLSRSSISRSCLSRSSLSRSSLSRFYLSRSSLSPSSLSHSSLSRFYVNYIVSFLKFTSFKDKDNKFSKNVK